MHIFLFYLLKKKIIEVDERSFKPVCHVVCVFYTFVGTGG